MLLAPCLTLSLAQVQDLEEKLRLFKSGAAWMDAPVENAHLFHRRFTKFMDHWIAGKPKGLLGRVTHYFVRYEVQGRGSRECLLVTVY
jgi:hypothetical protein